MSSEETSFDAELAPFRQWTDVSQHALNSYVEANNAVLAAMGLRPSGSRSSPSASTGASGAEDPAPVVELSFGNESWSMVRSSDERDELEVGDYVRFSKPIREADVSAFAQITGDTNRLHLEDEFAEETQFAGRIVHGTLVAGTISAALARLPGLTIYLSQDLEFHAPVELDETVTAECEIVEDLGSDRYRLRTTVSNEDDQVVIDGEAVVLVSESPDSSASSER
ncbi:MaoC family dehydratase [Natrialbaceae archaeon GCM10025810]|uniref:MaoC family dehydratase n=1 Tax=Halovalidus salilacus TaxID=3075124 RepID=UPI00361FBA4D